MILFPNLLVSHFFASARLSLLAFLAFKFVTPIYLSTQQRWVCSLENSWMWEQKWSIINVGGCSKLNIALQRCHATPGSCVSRISCQPFGCYGHHKYCTRSLSSSLLQLSRGGHAGVHGYGLSKYTCWGWQKTSKSFFTALPEGFKFQWHRYCVLEHTILKLP
jgi:hypothetical protein